MKQYHEVRNLFGPANIDYLLNYVKEGHMDNQQISDFAQFLGENGPNNNMIGNHKNRMEQKGSMGYASQVKAILNDWWGEELHDMHQEEAFQKLVQESRPSETVSLTSARNLRDGLRKVEKDIHAPRRQKKFAAVCWRLNVP